MKEEDGGDGYHSCITMLHTNKSNRGFAAMSAEKQREIASKGGKAAHAKGTAHEFTQDEAREAGRKGGKASGGKRKVRQSGMRETYMP